MNAISALLARAKAAQLVDPWPVGARVELAVAGVVTRGIVAFVEDGWVYWADDEARIHATPGHHLTRTP